MRRILAPADDLPLFDAASTRRIEQAALAALPGYTLMQRAGDALARLSLALAPHARCIRIVAGPGNNGGDGLEAAAVLRAWGKRVEVLLITDANRLGGDAYTAHARARAAGVCIDPTAPTALMADDLVIDALLGIGSSRAPEGDLAQAIEALNRQPCPVLAVDLPSGLNAGTGHPFGAACVRARHTLAMLTLKPGLFTGAGRDHAGSVWLDTLGVEPAAVEPTARLIGGSAPAATPRQHLQHKGSFGDVVVVGGAPGMTGAALLAARAAHAAGAGRVFVQLLDDIAIGHDGQRPELMLRRDWLQQSDAATLAASTVVCGCGGDDAVRAVLPRLLSRVPRLVLDADALNAIAADSMLQTLLRGRAAQSLATVLTPHPLEAARLLAVDSPRVQADRLAAAQELAERMACTVLLKGSGSVLAQPGQVPCINTTGNASLATAGTGDVLAGWLGGEWSQRRNETASTGTWAAAARTVWLHGAAADRRAHHVLRAADLIEAMACLS